MLMEIWLGNRWAVYDPDGNRRPVDARGRPLNIAQAVKQRPFHWRYFASDTYLESQPALTYRALDKDIAHAMGIPFIYMAKRGFYAFHVKNKRLRQRAENYSRGRMFVGKRRWQRLVRG